MQMIRTAKELLISKGLEATPARVQILAICMASDLPLDVNSVANKIGTKAHLATVYRNLEMFVVSGILERIDFQEGKFRYEYMHHHHHHAVCQNCGKVEDITESSRQIKAIENRLATHSGFSVTKHILELFGLCNNCQKKGIYAK